MAQSDASTANDSIYIPVDIEDACRYLDSQWSDSLKTYVRDSLDERSFIGMTHFSTGMYIRNNWGLWKGGTQLAQFFLSQEIYHPDDMSGVILTAFYRYLKHEDLAIDSILEQYKRPSSIKIKKKKTWHLFRWK